MKWTSLNELRESFLAFFESKGHLRMPSSPLVPQGDASLLLINSGMAPLKNYFTGVEAPPRHRMTTCQKCIRTPDIEQVGKTSRHGTFFEMLGNFSFGNYFKSEACAWAWEFSTKEMQMPIDKLWVSIYQDDDQAFDIWTKEVGVAPERIVRLGKADNFWEIGTGPCGPCSELYFDRGIEVGCGSPDCAVGCECDRYVEFWNLVFTQFDSDGKGNYTPLAKPNIDTGMGLERLACIMQGEGSIFEVDTMKNIMAEVATLAGVKYGQDDKTDVALRVVTDHIRSTVFMVGDGVTPQNEGRGYVLRRLLRRAARFGKMLGIDGTFLEGVAQRVIDENRAPYPELSENADYICQVIRLEEERFQKTLAQGMDMLAELVSAAGKGGQLSGEEAFKLYDTFGFPLDLTREIAEERGVSIDEDGFTEQMKLQRQRARAARAEQGDIGWDEDPLAGEDIEETFVGYELLQVKTQLLRIVKDGKQVDSVSDGEEAVLVLESTPFYAESGGQVGDTGVVEGAGGSFKVSDTKKSPSGHTLLIGKVDSGAMRTGDSVFARVDEARRRAITRNHTAAHLLQAALREVLGNHVHQAGQMVDENICRFDFSHFEALTAEDLSRVEARVNELCLASLPVTAAEMSMDAAKEKGAMALFGSKYSEIVRVVDINGESIELCGGCHVGTTAELGLLKILSEASVAAGVRRIEAVTGLGVLAHFEEREALMRAACETLKLGSPAELPAKVTAMTTQLRDLQKRSEALDQKMAGLHIAQLTQNMPKIGPVSVLTAVLDLESVPALKATADNLKANHPDIVGVLAMKDKIDPQGKATLIAFAGKDAVAAGIQSGKLVGAVAKLADGSGGGRPDSAMGGAQSPEKIDAALAAAQQIIEEQLTAK
ncbi:MAG: alanine--tRNA ligase [Oscillospiraceae bacterium]|nr:alanine--tRNA ligase [Oscillospiraceae bacterium]